MRCSQLMLIEMTVDEFMGLRILLNRVMYNNPSASHVINSGIEQSAVNSFLRLEYDKQSPS